jgi:hypothetical protein
MSHAHPPVKCFFLRLKRCSTYGRIFEADFALKSRGFGGFGSPSGQDEECEICCENNVRGLGSVGKIYQARTLCQNMVQHCPSILWRRRKSNSVTEAAFNEDDGSKIRHDPYILSCLQAPY